MVLFFQTSNPCKVSNEHAVTGHEANILEHWSGSTYSLSDVILSLRDFLISNLLPAQNIPRCAILKLFCN